MLTWIGLRYFDVMEMYGYEAQIMTALALRHDIRGSSVMLHVVFANSGVPRCAIGCY
jgi:hypothetical protein